MNPRTFTVTEPTDFKAVIDYIISQPHPTAAARLITLRGDLGAGKTTFTQELAKSLHITEPVVSPTFVVMKSYEVSEHEHFDQLIHIDAYRFEDVSEATPLGIEGLFLQPRTLICLEWPERIEELLPTDRVEVQISITDGETREVTVKH